MPLPDKHQFNIKMRQRRKTQTAAQRKNSQMPIHGANDNRFVTSIYWLGQNHKIIGFRHVMMLIMMTIMTMAGGLMFYLVEKPAEQADFDGKMLALKETFKSVAADMKLAIEQNKTAFEYQDQVKEYLKGAYVKMLSAEDKYVNSAIYKSQGEENRVWHFWSGVFFTTDIWMCVDYGFVPAISNLARCVVMIYGCISIPLAVVVVRDMGQWLLKMTTRLYARMYIAVRKCRGSEVTDDEEMQLPIPIALCLLMGYWFFAAFFLYMYDAIGYKEGSGMRFWDAFYLVYLTVTTIGLGDMAPNNVTRSPIWKYVCFIGMSIRVVNRCTYVKLEKGMFNWFSNVEEKMEHKMIPGGERQVNLNELPMHVPRGQVERKDTALPAIGRSVSTIQQPEQDVYGGDFGRVRINKAHLS